MRDVFLLVSACMLLLLGFALMALNQQRHAERVAASNQSPALTNRAQRAIGLGVIALGLPCCIVSQGGSFGSLMWVVLLPACAMAVAFTLTWRAHWLRPLARAIEKVSFREGLEALLVVAIATLYLRKTGRVNLLSAVRSGVVVAAVLSLALGYALSRIGALSPTAEGVMALMAAAAVIWCVVHMRRAGKTMGREITARLDQSTLLDGSKAWLAVFSFTLFMVGREGVETATMLASLASSAELGYMV